MKGAEATLMNTIDMVSPYWRMYSMNLRLRITSRNPPSSASRLFFFIFDPESGSCMRMLPASSPAPRISRHQNMPFHPATAAATPPATGAATVAMPLIAPIIPSIAASSDAEYLSVAIDLDRTTPPDPAKPWTSLMATN